MSSVTYDVIIVGCGPVGATLANLLARAGHHIAIADIHRDVFDQPRAINIDQEVLRCWQRIGIAAEIAASCEPHPGTDFVGADGDLIKFIYSAPPPYPLGWPANLMFIQPQAERLLRQRLHRFPNVTEFLGHQAVNIRQANNQVFVDLESEDGRQEIRGHWLVGCDGANSPIRKTLGISQEDLGFSEWYVVVDAWLKRATPLPLRTTQYCLPEAPTSYVVGPDTLRRWEMKVLPGEDPERYRDLDHVKRRMARFVDPGAVEFWRSAIYHFHAKVTDTWRRGRIFLAGDAAHQMPPFLGQGLCSGIRDAANLSWKLDRIIRGLSAESLLDTYEVERKPHIRVLTEVTKTLGEIVGETDRKKAEARDKKLREQLKNGEMETVRQNLIPPLKNGFLDKEDRSGLAGSLAVQPLLADGSRTVLADDLAGTGFALLTRGQVEPEAALALQGVEGAVLWIGPRHLDDVEGTFGKYMDQHQIEGLIVRPDGYVWSGQPDQKSVRDAVFRLVSCLSVKEI